MAFPINNGLLTCEEAATSLGISIRTLGRWARMGKGPPRIKIGRSIFYRRDAMEGWLLSLEGVA